MMASQWSPPFGAGIQGKTYSYEYDAWGSLITLSDSSSNGIGTINPLRYRGYYYDTDTGFYYLQSRYYDPVIGRFINADGLASTGQYISDGLAMVNGTQITYTAKKLTDILINIGTYHVIK